MSHSSALIDQAVGAELALRLRSLGFRKTARNFRRATPASLQIVNVQGSAWNFPESARFTVNLGVWLPAAAEALGEAPLDRAPPEYQCHVRSRIGMLSPDGRDLWWEITETDQIPAVAKDLAAAVVHIGMPWLDQFAAPAPAAAFCRDNLLFAHAAALAAAAGDRLQAEFDLARALQQSRADSNRTLRAWADVRELRPRPTTA